MGMVRQRPETDLLGLVFGIGLALSFPAGVHAQSVSESDAGRGISAGVTSSIAWSDNLHHLRDGHDRDAVLEASPWLTAHSSSSRAKYRLFYQLRNFVRLGDGETRLLRHALDGQGSFALVDDRFGVDLTGYLGTINASASGTLSADPAASFTNTEKVRYFRIAPWYRDRLSNLATYQLQYAFSRSDGDGDFVTAKADHRLFAVLTSLPGASRWSWSAYAQTQRREFRNGLNLDRGSSGGSLYYAVSPWLRVYGMVDYEQIENLRNRDGRNDGWGPGAGFDWVPFRRTTVGGSLSKRYYGNVGDLHVSHTTQRATMGLRWSRSILTSADASLLSYDPLSLIAGGADFGAFNPVLNSLYSAGIILPPGLVYTQGLFTDAAVLDRRLTAFWGLQGARNAATVTGFWADRESTTEIDYSSGIIGLGGMSSVGGIFVGRLRERGVAANYQYRIDRRSSVNLGLDRRIHDSPTADFETRWTTWSLSYRVRVTTDVTTFVGVRRTSQSGRGQSSNYDENMLYGGIDLRFY